MSDLLVDPLDALLVGTAANLDIPPQLQLVAEREYNAIGQFLSGHDEESEDGWDVYPQGSFRLGTVVRPILPGADYDIDLVSRGPFAKEAITQARLKEVVGDALVEYVERRGSVEGAPVKCVEGRRCWTLQYADPFHLDVLPAIPDANGDRSAILLTDTQLRSWQHSNPIAYAEWFYKTMAKELHELRLAAAVTLSKSLEEIPVWDVKTTLQTTVQILKRHRDLYFAEDVADRPPSILVTTLAAHAYRGEQGVADAVLTAAMTMTDHIDRIGGSWVVMNPVAEENFCDKWVQHPQRATKFFSWLDELEHDVRLTLKEAQSGQGLDAIVASLSKSLGAQPVELAATRMGEGVQSESRSGRLGMSATGALAVGGEIPLRDHTFFGWDEAEQ